MSASVPRGAATAAARYIGATSRQVLKAKARIVNGADPKVSIKSSVTAATRGLYTAAISGM